MVAGLIYSGYRLYQLRSAASLAFTAGQAAVVTFLVFSYRGGVYREPFVMLTAFAVGVFVPLVFLYADLAVLRKKIKARFGLSLTRFVFRDDQIEVVSAMEKDRFIDGILRPRADSFPIDEIMGEIRVERADTSKNIQKQLEAASKKYDEGEYEAALGAYLTIEKVFNRSQSLYLNIGNVEYDRGGYEAAAGYYRRGAECAVYREFEHDDMSEKLGAINYNLGNACFHQRKYGRAIEAYKSASELYSAGGDALYNLSFCHAMDFEDTGDTEKAVEAFKALVEDMPDNLHAWFHYGKCLLKMKLPRQAIECFQKVVGEDVMFYEAWYRLAMAYDGSGMVADAVKAYYTSIQIKPDFIDSYNDLGVLLSTAGRHGEALRVLKSGLRIKPGDAELIYNIGMTLYESGKYEEALAEFKTCERFRPDDGAVLYMLALIFMNLGQPEDAMGYLEKAVQKDPAAGARAARDGVFGEYVGSEEYGRLFQLS